jgi:hypothetical protein
MRWQARSALQGKYPTTKVDLAIWNIFKAR